jgi:hypothetical protein
MLSPARRCAGESLRALAAGLDAVSQPPTVCPVNSRLLFVDEWLLLA